MENDCIYLVDDGNLTSGGCCKCYCSCPYYIKDNMDLGCGGYCYETSNDTEEDKEDDNNEEDKK